MNLTYQEKRILEEVSIGRCIEQLHSGDFKFTDESFCRNPTSVCNLIHLNLIGFSHGFYIATNLGMRTAAFIRHGMKI
jgi:hypothetical protein